MTTESTALERYNRLFNNAQYSAIADHVAADLHVLRDSARVSDVMNEITNVALSLCNHSHYADAWLTLATFCGQNPISAATIDAIYAYLLIFQPRGDTRADDFQMTTHALKHATTTMGTLGSAVSYANGIHGWRGRMAYHLLAASDFFVQAAIQLLIDGDLSYIREKLQSGLRRLTDALSDSTRHSPRPEMFEFGEIKTSG